MSDKRFKNNSINKIYVNSLINKYKAKILRLEKQRIKYPVFHYRYQLYSNEIKLLNTVINDLGKV